MDSIKCGILIILLDFVIIVEVSGQQYCYIQDTYQSIMTATMNTKHCLSTPEYLINRKTQTCLSVIEGESSHNTVIGLEKCNGNARQQWFPVDGQWQWGGNRKLCLAHKGKGNIHLAPCDSVNDSWVYDENEGTFSVGSVSLGIRVGNPSQPVKLWQQKGGANKRWWTSTSMRRILEDAELAEHCFPEEAMDICKKEMKVKSQQKKKRRQLRRCLIAADSDGVCSIEESQVDKSEEAPDYLISQRDYKCLTVIAGSSADDAVIGMAQYSDCVIQQWFVKDGHWHWGANRALCLAANWNNRKVVLRNCSSALPIWHIDKAGLMSSENHALEVQMHEDEVSVILSPMLGSIGQKWWALSDLKQYIGKKLYPFAPKDSTKYRDELMRGLLNSLSPLSDPLPYPRDVTHFPGAVAPSTPRVNRVINLDIQNLGHNEALCMRAPPRNWHVTSLYIVAGDIVSIIFPDSLTQEQASQIRVRVGAQTDNLNPKVGKIKKGRALKRMPVVSEVFDLQPGVNLLRSQYGGNLIFLVGGKESFLTTVEVHNVVETAHYILNKTREEDWNKMKALQIPYSILEGNRVVLVVPTRAARKTPEPKTLLQQYDQVVSLIEDLSGFDEKDPPPRGKHWLVDDIQISAGSAHAGFPTMFERRFYTLSALGTPHSWVVWHELGHNYQQPRHWSNIYGSETTVNLFSLYVQEQLKGAHRMTKNGSFGRMAKEVDQGMTFQSGGCGAKLVFLMEIQNSFPEKGWDIYRHLKKTTRALSQEDSKKVKANKQNQVDYVYKTLSQFIGIDLLPHYQRWGIKVSEDARDHIGNLVLPKCFELAVRK